MSCVTGDECRLLVLRPTHVCGNGCRKGRRSCSPPSCLWTPGPPRIPCLPPIVAYHPSETHFAGRSCSALDRVPPSPQPCSSEDLTAQKGQGETGQALLCTPPPALIVDQIDSVQSQSHTTTMHPLNPDNELSITPHPTLPEKTLFRGLGALKLAERFVGFVHRPGR